MKCVECKWYLGTQNDTYGVCKRYPKIENKTQQDYCGEFYAKVEVRKIEITFAEPTEYDINTDEIKPKRGRKPKA